MTDVTSHPGSPSAWRRLVSDDIGAVSAFAAACLRVDGGLPFAADEGFARPRFLPPAPGTTLGAFDPAGELIAAAAVRPDSSATDHRVVIAGLVHPAHRGQGIGTFLLQWSIAQGRSLLAAAQPEVRRDRPGRLVIATEGLTDAAARLYERNGFAEEFAEDVMRRDLAGALPEAAFPPGITVTPWTPERAGAFFEANEVAFRDRLGFRGLTQEEWVEWTVGDDDFRPAMSLLACSGDEPVGFTICDEAWIARIGVRPGWRRHGLGAALLAEDMRRFRAEGCDAVSLAVNVNNPTATRLYTRLGFEVVGRRARWALEIV
jgi:mycothiol synthase